MSAAEAPKSEQIQANVAAALSRLRGELGAASSPVAGTAAQNPVPKTPAEPAEPAVSGPDLSIPGTPSPGFTARPAAMPNVASLPAGPLRAVEPEPPTTAIRPFEPTLGAAMGAAGNDDMPPPRAEAAMEEAPRQDLFGGLRADPGMKTERDTAPTPDPQPDLLSGMEVPPAPPPPLGSFSTEDEVGGRGRRMRNRLLVLLVAVVLIGGGAWAYLSQHPASEGPIPVITADTTPEKVKPTDEGGMEVPNQNVQILDNMNGDAASGQGQETVMPPPEQPVAPPVPDTSAATPPAVTEEPAAASSAPTAVDQPAVPTVAAPAIPSVSAPEPGQSAATATEEPAPATQQAAPEPSAAAPAPAEPPKAEAPKAEAPKTEPAKTETPAATQTATAPATPAPATPAAATGNVRIQLAAVKSDDAAKTQWAKLQKAHPDLLGALSLNVQTVDKAGVTYYRIQAGPIANKADAKALCAKLMAQKQDCIVAK